MLTTRIKHSQILLFTMMAMSLARRRDVPAGARAIGYHKIAEGLDDRADRGVAHRFAASLWVMPHVLTDTELHLRYAMFAHVVVPCRLITSAHARLGSHGTPFAVQIGRTAQEVTEVRFWADEHEDWLAQLSTK